MTLIGTISESLEDYLEAIYQLQEDGGTARVSDIATARGVSMASVCQALQRLDRDGYVHYTAHETLQLTDKGLRLAQNVRSRHEFLHRFLSEILGVDEDAAERDACALEHHLSTETLSHLVAFTQFMESSPCLGGSISERFRECEPTGRVMHHEPASLPGHHRGRAGRWRGSAEGPTLASLQPGEKARVVHIHARCSIRQRLVDMGILPGVEVEMVRKAPLGDPVEVRLKGFSLSLRLNEALAIEVERLKD
ncbi:DtxR family transcriptional regulator [Candidatus Fermentibacterales bacterium]|nr:DtxR family transcriptional regulator [Candidatus Fermentibacterales bacterium]